MIKVIIFNLIKLLKKKGYLNKKGVIQYRKAARDIEISHSSLWKMSNQDKMKDTYNPSIETIDRLCDFFKCQPGDILKYRKGE